MWTETGMWEEDFFNEYPFSIYHLSICGIDLMQGESSQMISVISTGVHDLYLPYNLWKMVMSWVGAQCDESLYPPKQPHCTLTSFNVTHLPPLVFKLSEFSPEIFLPFSFLLEPTSTENIYKYLFLFLFYFYFYFYFIF